MKKYVFALCLAGLAWPLPVGAEPLKVVTTVGDLASIVRAVGGDEVDVTALARGTEDPHFIEARPSFLKALHQADVFVQVGFDLEKGWVPPLLQNARNPAVASADRGFVDASSVITPLELPAGDVTRAMGDVHVYGNPHYLLDPLNGLRVAALIRDRLAKLRPDRAEGFVANYQAFRKQMGDRMVGVELASKYPFEKLVILHRHGKLGEFLGRQGEQEKLGGWLGRLLPHFGVKAVDEHNLWPYFAERFGIGIIGHFEPKPGVSPTTQQLMTLVKEMKAQDARLILSTPYFDQRHAKLVAEATGAVIVPMAHQVGSRPAAGDYLAMFDHNVGAVASALGKR